MGVRNSSPKAYLKHERNFVTTSVKSEQPGPGMSELFFDNFVKFI